MQEALIKAVVIALLTVMTSQKAYSEEHDMLKSKLYKPTNVMNIEKKSLLSSILNSSNIYEFLLSNPDFAKVQDMSLRLWDRHTNIRKYRTYMKDDFIQTGTLKASGS
uniref:Uncharacterized protein n=1 Tax=uncultured Thiotrichaceae bacterium TaxID=298394 RepID=A0A6S6RVR3_9GAMM|nr:MAG: Unknown protein [uncultured Thiotrichaceae bacterium]